MPINTVTIILVFNCLVKKLQSSRVLISPICYKYICYSLNERYFIQTGHFIIIIKDLWLVNHRTGVWDRAFTATLHSISELILKAVNPFVVIKGISGCGWPEETCLS